MRSSRKLQSHASSTLYYVDSNIFFYAKMNDAKYGSRSTQILQLIVSETLRAATSSLVILEVANSLRKFGQTMHVQEEVRAMLSLPMQLEELTPVDSKRASELFTDNRISPYDCAHIAVMERIDSTEIISADRDFDKVRQIRRIDPLDPEISRMYESMKT